MLHTAACMSVTGSFYCFWRDCRNDPLGDSLSRPKRSFGAPLEYRTNHLLQTVSNPKTSRTRKRNLRTTCLITALISLISLASMSPLVLCSVCDATLGIGGIDISTVAGVLLWQVTRSGSQGCNVSWRRGFDEDPSSVPGIR